MIGLTLNCSTDFRQEQKLEQKLELLQMVRCLLVYLDGTPTPVPIRPEVSTRKAKKTGYEYITVRMEEAKEGGTWAAMHDMNEEFPMELDGIVYFMNPNRPGPGGKLSNDDAG